MWDNHRQFDWGGASQSMPYARARLSICCEKWTIMGAMFVRNNQKC